MASKYIDIDSAQHQAHVAEEEEVVEPKPDAIGGDPNDKRSLWMRLTIPFGLACLLFVIIVLPVYYDNLFLRITVLVVLVIGLLLCVVGILQSKQCRQRRRLCQMNQLGNGKLSGHERY